MEASETLKLCVPILEGKGNKEPKVCRWMSWFIIRRKWKLSAGSNEWIKKKHVRELYRKKEGSQWHVCLAVVSWQARVPLHQKDVTMNR